MKYDFETFVARAGKDCIATDVVPFPYEPEEGISRIPMWVADMSYPTAPFIVESMRKRLDTPSFGYFQLTREFFDSIIYWHARCKDIHDLKPEYIGYENSVLGGVNAAVEALTAPGEKILVHTPVYVGFKGTSRNTGRPFVFSELKPDENGIWRMDFEDMDRKIKENNIHFAIFCSPHNPTGRVWERWEIEKAMEVYARNDCVVVSDEIWSDIVMPGSKHIPTQSISEDARNRVLAFYSPSKTFSLAGLVGAYHVVYNKTLRDKLVHRSDMTHYNCVNLLTMHAMVSSYSDEGVIWANELVQVLDRNCAYAYRFICENFPGVRVMRPQGTYMLYLDCSDWCKEHNVDIHELQKRGVLAGVIWQDGEAFLINNTIRMNLAVPFDMLKDAFARLKDKAFV